MSSAGCRYRWGVLVSGLILIAQFSAAAAPKAPPAPASAPAPAGPNANMFANASFESSSSPAENLWDGVSSDGTLAGFNASALVVSQNGKPSPLAMPPSIAYVDLNADGKPDLITADPTGYFRFYPNSGTAAAPKFTCAQIIPLYLSTGPAAQPWRIRFHGVRDAVRRCPRFALADWRRTGMLDMIVGNYYGEVFFIPNSGTARQPIYLTNSSGDRVPTTPAAWGRDAENDDDKSDNANDVYNADATGIDKARIPTNDQGRYWANLISPAAYDWTGDGKIDLICGEGTYSANSIHLLENMSTGAPQFSNTKRTFLAYGDGREQLIPTVADFNGDGLPDLMVADRTGEVGLYLSTAKPKAGVVLERTSTMSFGGSAKLPGLCSIYAADFNADGLIDLVIGLPNGHLAWAQNTGTANQPKFDPIQELKGTDFLGRNLRSPDDWTTFTSSWFGNALGYVTVVGDHDDPTAKPPDGANCLKAAYWPQPAGIFPMPPKGIPGSFRHFAFSSKGMPLTVGKNYHLSFQTKGVAMDRLRWAFNAHYAGAASMTKNETGERGAVKKVPGGGNITEYVAYSGNAAFNPGWTTVQGDISPRYKSPELAGESTMSMILTIDFWAQDIAAAAYFDNFRLTVVEK